MLSIEEIKRLYLEEKKSATEIANITGVHKTTIARTLKRNNVRLRKSKDYSFVIPMDELENLYIEQNLTYQQIADKYNIATATVCRIIKEAKISKNCSEAYNFTKIKLPDNDLIKLYKEGKSLLELSKLYNVDPGTIKKRLIKYRVSITENHSNSLKNLERTPERKEKHRKAVSGKNHFAWKGRTPLKLQIRKCYLYRRWRTECFKRDNYTCQNCLKKGGSLQVDHIKPFAILLEENKINSFPQAEKCKQLWNINNGKTLCKQCHLKTDTWGHKTTKLLEKNN